MLREQGYSADVVERFIHQIKRRKDLFGIIDVVGVGPEGTVAIQCTSRSNVSSRVKKIKACDHLPNILAAGWRVIVHGWFQDKDGAHDVRIVEIDEWVDPLEIPPLVEK